MAPTTPIEPRRTDLDTYLVSLAARLRLHGHAVRGTAEREGDSNQLESRVKAELAGDLDMTATYLEEIRSHLCSSCLLIEIVETVAVEKA